MANKTNRLFKISKPFLIMVEGKDDAEMLYKFCEHINVSRELFQIFQYKGKEKFPAALKSLTNTEEFEIVQKLAIFRDADECSDSAFQSIEHHLRANELIPSDAVPTSQGAVTHSDDEQAPISIGVFITPNCSDTGALESLLLGSLTGDMQAELDGFIIRSEALLSTGRLRQKYKHSDKSKTYAYSALFENASFHDTFNKRLWDYDHASFEKLKSFFGEFNLPIDTI